MNTNEEATPKAETKRRFTLEVKYMILKEHRESGVPVSLLARKYQVHPITIYQWKRALMKKSEESYPSIDYRVEYERIQQENKQLKKALADMAVGKCILEDAVEILKKKLVPQKFKSPKRS